MEPHSLPHPPEHHVARGVCSLDIRPAPPVDGEPPAAPEWVHLIPAGTFSGLDGRGPYTLDAAAVLAAFQPPPYLPIDYEHQSVDADQKNGPAPAAGWIHELELREDGVWGRVEWTDRAAAMIAQREYRYVSPVFQYRPKTGRVVRLLGAGLTHAPNLPTLRAVARADMEDAMSQQLQETLDKVCAALGIATDSGPQAVAAHAAAMKEELDRLREKLEKATGKPETPDPKEWVPMSQHRAVAEQLAQLQQQLARRDAEEAVTAAMAEGKLPPAMKEWALGYAMSDPDGFKEYVEKAPKIVEAGERRASHANGGGKALSDEELAVCRNLGISPEEYAKHNQHAEEDE